MEEELTSLFSVFMEIEKFNISLMLDEKELEAFYYALISAKRTIRDRANKGWNTPYDAVYLTALTRIYNAARVRNPNWTN